jgi:DNA-binding PadR family transcriptional regulator
VTDILTAAEMALLAAIFALKDDAYGLAVYHEACKGFKIKYGSLYPILDRLENQGLISSTPISDGTGGRPRRYFRLEGPGYRAFNESSAAYARLGKVPLLAPGRA